MNWRDTELLKRFAAISHLPDADLQRARDAMSQDDRYDFDDYLWDMAGVGDSRHDNRGMAEAYDADGFRLDHQREVGQVLSRLNT